MPLGSGEEEAVPILAKEDIKIPPRTEVVSKGEVDSGRQFSRGIYQVAPIAERSNEEVSL